MSSILDALKRLESESPDPTPPPGGNPTFWLAQSEVTAGWLDRLWETVITRRRLWITTVVSLAAIVAAVAAVWLAWPALNRNTQHPKPVPATSNPQPAAGPAAPLPATVDPRTATTPSPKPPVPRPVPLLPPAPAPAAAIAPPPARPAGDAPAAMPAPRAPKPAPARRSTPYDASSDDPAFFPLPLPTSAGLGLQAISWSEQTDRRIVVINNRVLHLGQVIDGYAVETIDPDSVTLSRAGRAYVLAFRPRSN